MIHRFVALSLLTMGPMTGHASIRSFPARPGRRVPRDATSALYLRQTFVLKSTRGLHAAPSALLVRTLEPFACATTVENSGHAVNPRSILSVLSLAAGYGSSLTFTFHGDDAHQALMAVKHLFDTQFADAYQGARRLLPRHPEENHGRRTDGPVTKESYENNDGLTREPAPNGNGG